METFPNRASDAGPDDSGSPDWRDHISEAEDWLKLAYRSDEGRLRSIYLGRAEHHIDRAKALLSAEHAVPVKHLAVADQQTARRWAAITATEVRG